jgi:hypothetical protein
LETRFALGQIGNPCISLNPDGTVMPLEMHFSVETRGRALRTLGAIIVANQNARGISK